MPSSPKICWRGLPALASAVVTPRGGAPASAHGLLDGLVRQAEVLTTEVCGKCIASIARSGGPVRQAQCWFVVSKLITTACTGGASRRECCRCLRATSSSAVEPAPEPDSSHRTWDLASNSARQSGSKPSQRRWQIPTASAVVPVGLPSDWLTLMFDSRIMQRFLILEVSQFGNRPSF